MTFRFFRHSLGCPGFELNFIGKKLNIRIASRQFAIWWKYRPIIDICRFHKTKSVSTTDAPIQ